MAALLLPLDMAVPLCVGPPAVSPDILISSNVDASQIGLEPTLTGNRHSLTFLPILRPYLQAQPCFEVLGVRVSTNEFWTYVKLTRLLDTSSEYNDQLHFYMIAINKKMKLENGIYNHTQKCKIYRNTSQRCAGCLH